MDTDVRSIFKSMFFIRLVSIMAYTIGKVSELTGLSSYTLRYYEKEGLLPFVTRDESGIRIFQDSDLAWLSMIECLKQSGLPIKEIALYISWFREGDSTLDERLEMFRNRQKVVEAEIAKMNTILNKIKFKVKLYEEAVKLGSLDNASTLPKIEKMKKELFDAPEDFDKTAKAGTV